MAPFLMGCILCTSAITELVAIQVTLYLEITWLILMTLCARVDERELQEIGQADLFTKLARITNQNGGQKEIEWWICGGAVIPLKK